MWTPGEVISFATDCVANGVKAISLGGGEPFEYDGVFDVIDALCPQCYLSVTTNGLPLMEEKVWDNLLRHSPDKIHITIHNPDNANEVERVERQIRKLQQTTIKPGVNLLVGADKVEYAQRVYQHLLSMILADQIIVIPQRFGNTPTPKQLALVANNKPFQSPSCLLGCKRPETFVSVSWDKKVNSCSYANGKQELKSLDFRGLTDALIQVHWESCTS